MTSRQTSWPRQWLMTDERIGDCLWFALGQLPEGEAGVVVRHYSMPAAARAAFAHRVAEICHARRLVLAVAANEGLACRLGAELVHNPPQPTPTLPFSIAVHSRDQAIAAKNSGAALVFISPVLKTRSHPDRPPLGIKGAIGLANIAQLPAIALGGMNARTFAPLERGGFHGWAGIDAWIRQSDQNLNAVPT